MGATRATAAADERGRSNWAGWALGETATFVRAGLGSNERHSLPTYRCCDAGHDVNASERFYISSSSILAGMEVGTRALELPAGLGFGAGRAGRGRARTGGWE